MTKEDKVKKKKARAYNRKRKRIERDKEYIEVARIKGSTSYQESSISWGRRKLQGKIYTCEMGYYSCELRGYCNGDC